MMMTASRKVNYTLQMIKWITKDQVMMAKTVHGELERQISEAVVTDVHMEITQFEWRAVTKSVLSYKEVRCLIK